MLLTLASSSHLCVANTVEKSLAPRVAHGALQGSLLDSVLDVAINFGAIDGTAVGYLTILELEVVAVHDCLAVLLENLQKSGLIFDISIGAELAKGEEVLTVDAVVALALESEGSHVKAHGVGSDAATETRLLLIKGLQVDTSVLVPPETTEHALHVATSHHRVDLVLAGSVEAPGVLDALTGAGLVKASHSASQEECHFF
eukprot:CAMPEP_0170471940 /NCGR_PEP_ID=MMETSP0123-20130129/14064_1 /TAXON_ID=182087 /ORGANISM="Favella ehrenbergii, Strain Fehren 1" /LENGTH=200 /DNA_ID=CAMNT_0010739899 /DNA_START=72 /DNA_END=671 /DNA_ORIENTATION=-